MGLGAYHAGIECDGVGLSPRTCLVLSPINPILSSHCTARAATEWSFGFVDSDATGVFSCEPRCADGAVYRESMLMGYTSKSGWQLDNLIAEMQLKYRGHDYHMYLNNCITFSDDLCFRLTQRHIPSWLNRLPHIANSISCCLPRYLRGPYPLFDDDSSDSVDSEKAPILPPTASDSAAGGRLTIPRGDPRRPDYVPPAAAKKLGVDAAPGTTTTTTTTAAARSDGDGAVPSTAAVL